MATIVTTVTNPLTTFGDAGTFAAFGLRPPRRYGTPKRLLTWRAVARGRRRLRRGRPRLPGRPVSARYAHLTEAFLASGPAMARFVEANTRHRFAACPDYPDYHPERPGATAGGRCLDMLPADLSAMVPLARQVRVPPGYLPMTHAEWERWRYPSRFDWDQLNTRLAAGIRTNGVALAAALINGVIRAGARRRGARARPPPRSRGPGLARQGT
jgi:hypothetical protein